MLKKFQTRNYMNFKDTITIDFSRVGGYHFSPECITDDFISKMVIYGRNATGKTNLGAALFDIRKCFVDSRYYNSDNGVFLNADSTDPYAEFVYVFQFEETELVYRYRRTSETELFDEELIINRVRCFYCNYYSREFYFVNLGLLEAETVVTDRFLQSLNTLEDDGSSITRTPPFLRWIISNTALKAGSILLKLNSFIARMFMMSANSSTFVWSSRLIQSFSDSLEDEKALADFQNFLNMMGVEGDLVCKKLPDGHNQLYFKHNTLVPFFESASSGTMALFNLYRRIEMGKRASLMYLDEFDAFYHYEMSEKVIQYIKLKYPRCQVIFTTHNTNLMTNRLMRPDCLFIISRTGTLTALCDATSRELREGHNLEKMYISGEFERYE